MADTQQALDDVQYLAQRLPSVAALLPQFQTLAGLDNVIKEYTARRDALKTDVVALEAQKAEGKATIATHVTTAANTLSAAQAKAAQHLADAKAAAAANHVAVEARIAKLHADAEARHKVIQDQIAEKQKELAAAKAQLVTTQAAHAAVTTAIADIKSKLS